MISARLTRDAAIPAILFCLTIAIYIPSLYSGFLNWDDPEYLVVNDLIHSSEKGMWEWFFTEYVIGNWHPLTMMSLALDEYVWGEKPFGFHLTSVVINASNTVLVYFLTLFLVRLSPRQWAGGADFKVAGVVALLFAITPVHVESVSWISERKDLLYAFFYLTAIICYLRFRVATCRSQRAVYFTLVHLFFGFSLMSKSMAVSLPLVLVGLDWFLFRLARSSPWSLREFVNYYVLEKSLLYVGSLSAAVIAMVSQADGGAIVNLDFVPIGERVINVLYSYAFYVIKAIYPLGLVPFYPHPATSPYQIASLYYLLGILLIVLLLASLFIRWRGRELLQGGLYVHLVGLLPILGIVPLGSHLVATRYLYLAVIPVFYLVVLGAHKYLGVRVKMALLATVMVVLISNNIGYQRVWANSQSFWSYQISSLPDTHALAYYMRGRDYYSNQEYVKALADIEHALRMDPKKANAHELRGLLYARAGDYEVAISAFDKAIELSARASAYGNRGAVFEVLGNYPRAIFDFERALMLTPTDPKPRNRLVNIYQRLGNLEMVSKYRSVNSTR